MVAGSFSCPLRHCCATARDLSHKYQLPFFQGNNNPHLLNTCVVPGLTLVLYIPSLRSPQPPWKEGVGALFSFQVRKTWLGEVQPPLKSHSTMKLQSGFVLSGWGSPGDSRVQWGVAAIAAGVGREPARREPAQVLPLAECVHVLSVSGFSFRELSREN